MAQGGASTGNGGGNAPPRGGGNTLKKLQSLASKTGAKADDDLTAAIKDIRASTKVDANQNDTDTQKFFNGIGWADKKPKTVGSEKELSAAEFRGEVYGQAFYHTDDPFGTTTDAKAFAQQYMKGRQYLSDGIHGDGTYWSNKASDSWRYGLNRMAYQMKGKLNTNAKVITEAALDKKITAFARSHPKAWNLIRWGLNTNRGNSYKSVFAALFGYNVIQSQQNGCDYLTVLDRSATTVVSEGIHRHEYDSGKKRWK